LTGSVAAGGQTTLTITLPDVGQDGCSFTATGTVSQVSGSIPSTCFKSGTVATGSFEATSQAATVLSGPFSISGTMSGCGSSDAFTITGTVTIALQPALASLAAAGGQVTGTFSASGIQSFCGAETPSAPAADSSFLVTGSVAAGGQTTLTITQIGGHGEVECSSTATGTPSEISGTIPSACFDKAVATGTFTAFSQNPAAPSITTTLLSSETVLTANSQTLTAMGGIPPYTFTLMGGALPPGLGLSSAGVLSGTPTTAGSYTFTVKVTDAAGNSVVGTYTLTVAAQSVTITTPSPLPSGMATVQYPQQVLMASGGSPPYTFSVPANSLPSGLTLSSGGAISGTPTVTGTFTFTLTATDSTGQTGTASLSLTIRPVSPDLITSSGSLSFALAAGATTLPLGETVQVESTDVTKTLSWSTTITPAETWLRVSPGGTTPGAFTVSLTSAASSLVASATPYHTTISVACLAPSPCAGSAQSVAVSLLVSEVPSELTALTDLLSFTTSSTNPQTTTQMLGLRNAGGGTITFTSVTCGQPFCVTGAAPASLGAGATGNINIQANPAGLSPGYYYTAVTIVSSAGTISVPVTLFIATGSSLSLNPSGVELTMPAGGVAANPDTSFLVSVSGGASPASQVAFTAAVLPGAPWLNASTTSGSATGDAPGSVGYSINATAAAALTPQAYYGTIRVTSPDAVNAPPDFQVVLDVTAANTPQVPNPTPGGLIFISNGTTPPAQIDQVFASSVTAVPYQASASTANGGSWLSVNPATGTTSAASPAQSSISVNLAGLAAGVYRGSVSYSLATAAVPTVNVTLVVGATGEAAGDRTAAQSGRALGPEATAACTPTQIVPTQTGLVDNFSAPASWPMPLEIQLNDNCGNPVANGQVVATFSNGDPPLGLNLENSASGLYSGTWTPRTTGPQVVVTATATAPGFAAATTQISGAVAPNVAPILNQNGTLNAFAITAEPGIPIAPGTIVQIYGSGLAAQTITGSTIPLMTSLGGTSVIIGGIEAPLYFVSAGQIDAQVPFELTAGQPYQVIVNANGALTTPQTIQSGTVSPGIAEYSSGYAIAQHAATFGLITDGSPATPGEYVVVYLSGMGPTTVPVASGAASPSSPLDATVNSPTITLNGEAVTNIYFSGLTPMLAGLYQIDLQVPADAPNGDLTLVVNQPGFQGTPVILPVHN
jgi:large repetitive protein